MLELQALSYHPATAAAAVLHDVSMQLISGEPALVAGRSGSGKTTLLELISGLADPDGGQILWNGDQLNAANGAGSAAWCSSSRNAISWA